MSKNWTPNIWHLDQPISNIAIRKIATETMSKKSMSIKSQGMRTPCND